MATPKKRPLVKGVFHGGPTWVPKVPIRRPITHKPKPDGKAPLQISGPKRRVTTGRPIVRKTASTSTFRRTKRSS